MRIPHHPSIAFLILMLASGLASATHLNVTYSGDINFILADDGTGLFSGVGVGDIVTGSFNYGLNDSTAVISPDSPGITGETDYLFSGSPYSSNTSSGTTSVSTNDAIIVITNDDPIGTNPPDTTGLTELGTLAGFPISQGDPFDGWTARATSGNIDYGFTMFSFTNLNLMANESYISMPPAAADVTAFIISETNAVGDLIYLAIGTVDMINTTIVPLPAAFWLFGSGLLGLIGMARRKKAA